MPTRIVPLPNGHVTHSGRVTRVRVHPALSAGPERPFVEVFEGQRLVYRGPLDRGDGVPARTPDQRAAAS